MEKYMTDSQQQSLVGHTSKVTAPWLVSGESYKCNDDLITHNMFSIKDQTNDRTVSSAVKYI